MAGNPFFDISVEEGRLLAESKADAQKQSERIIPFGERPARSEDWRKAVTNDAAFREKELKRMGHKEFLSHWKGRK